MGRPATLLEGLCGHALSLGAESVEVEHKDGRERLIERTPHQARSIRLLVRPEHLPPLE
jgi:hypothetical protein